MRHLNLWSSAALLAATAAAQPIDLPKLETERLATLTLPGADGYPITMTTAPDGPALYVGFKAGIVLEVENGVPREEPFLDLSSRTGGESTRGLLGLVFHPDYQNNRRLFVSYTNEDYEVVLARFDSDGERALPETEVTLFEIAQQAGGHTGGHLAFGADGMLYIAVGDGHTGEHPAADPRCFAQDDTSFLGKMLRLDVDTGAAEPPYFSVPADNPVLERNDGATAVWAKGLRHPWRYSFDRETGDLYIGDVGRNDREEIDFEPASSSGGRNYGWKQMEGTLCRQDAAGCGFEVADCGDSRYEPPILEYPLKTPRVRCSVIGGYVYRGTLFPALSGLYFYGDFCTGAIFVAWQQGGEWKTTNTGLRIPAIVSFAEDRDGELYGLSANGAIDRIQTAPIPCVADESTLCLRGGRFEARATWQSPQGTSGIGGSRPITDDSGAFWFFDPENVEILVKVLDACEAFDRFWVFTTGLTNVEVQLTLRDTLTGTTWSNDNPLGSPYPLRADTDAFETCGF